MKCSVCKKDLIGNRKVANDKVSKKTMAINGALMLIGGPLVAAIAGFGLGIDLVRSYRQYSKDEVEVTCPHCKAKLILTNEEFETLKTEIEKVQAEERKSKQNRVEY